MRARKLTGLQHTSVPPHFRLDFLLRLLLAIESSCDETSAAVVTEDRRVLSNVVASQFELHQEFGGVVPEIASRAHVRRILPVLDEALSRADCQLGELNAVAVTSEPGLVGSLLVGFTAAKTLAMSLNVPLITVNHIDAHIYACGMGSESAAYPSVGFVVSGGHTNLYDCQSATDSRLFAGTTDDAAGEAFDKVARILGLPYPGGPSIQEAAESGNPNAFKLPRPMMRADRTDFSFSGLKTAVLYKARGLPGPDQLNKTPVEIVPDLAASFQQAVVDVLVFKCRLALKKLNCKRLCVGGGVAANRLFREQLTEMCRRHGVELLIAPLELCTDNAAMAAIAWEYLEQGLIAELDADILPGLVRPGAKRR
ncbi:MAG: tRNA (adenosine(37)-N6)-threonylcarbamoyltransferase complex transferase subunit TsaD [Fuerstiella sp.]|nr:tRNA (adenosine(37)-N6)-threonylcarbamoyltransferase complex transferase subunit TsaD [Fuerstiella sp.]MCP4505850.1 tRNA (adenosine(37)-N6)-threonylcarbamoyltransferase complex transferase subunit TsaD [Fuerstiella sp.]